MAIFRGTGETGIGAESDFSQLVADAEAAAASAAISEDNAAASATAAANAAAGVSDDADAAALSASLAATSATNSANSATNAATSASSASTYATNAANSASSASTSATNASNSATSASSSATSANTSKLAAATSATNAASSASSASTSATNASTSATSAATSATTATTQATNASNSASAASTSATSAANSATTASTAATNAATSATNAANSATSAGTSATNAASSATSASTSATAAALSETNAASSATSSSNSASSAATSATNASNSASSASTSATNAATSETNAANSATAAAASYDNFDDRYLGSKATDPTLDNDGNALLTGALYWNSTSNVMKAYSGSAWVTAYAPSGSYALSGANSDITSMSGITGGISTPDYITFDTTPETTPTAAGSLYWDSADGNQTLSLIMAGGDVVQQIGQEQYYRIKASSAITNGQVVMFTGSVGDSGALTGAPATGLTAATASYVMGIATQDIAHNGWGYVTSFGLVRDLNTSSYTDGAILYLDPSVAGGLTATVPTAPTPKVQVCAVTHAATNGSLFVRLSFGGTLGQYEGDVSVTSPATGDVLVRNSSGVWENSKTLSGAYTFSGGTAKGVAYLNGSKVLTTGSALTFDGTKLGVGLTVATQSVIGAKVGVASGGSNTNTVGTSIGMDGAGSQALSGLRWTGVDFAGVSGNNYSTQFVTDSANSLATEFVNTGATPFVWGLSGTEQMRLASTGLGIGTSSPGGYSAKLAVIGGDIAVSGDALLKVLGAGYDNTLQLYSNATGNMTFSVGFPSGSCVFKTNSAERMRIDSSGNLGLGVTPSAWGSGAKALEMTYGAYAQGVGGEMNIVSNAYEYATGAFKYKYSSLGASKYSSVFGQHQWYTAPSGTAGNAISFTQAMTLDASGSLLIGATSKLSSETLQVYGNFSIYRNGSFTGYLGAGSTLISSAGAADFAIRSDAAIVFSTSGATERVRIDSSGNLGVGTSSPATRIHAYGSAGPAASITAESNSNSGGQFVAKNTIASYSFGVTGSTAGNYLVYDNTNTQLAQVYVPGTSGYHVFYTQGSERMRIDSSGNVGIGTSSPSNRMTILTGTTGNVTAASWSDGSSDTGYLGIRTGGGVGMWAGGFLAFGSGSGTFTERMRIDASGNVLVTSGVTYGYQVAPTAKSTTATLTGAELVTGILSTTGTSYTVTLPTGTNIDAAVSSSLAANGCFDWTVINTASGTITIGANSNTTLGSLTIATGTSAQFRFRKTAANTYTVYRIS